MTLRHMLPSFSGSSRLSVGGDCPVCDLEPGSLCHFQAGVAGFPCPPETFLEGIGLPCARRQRLRRGRTGHLTQPASRTSERAHGDSGHPAAPAACPPRRDRPHVWLRRHQSPARWPGVGILILQMRTSGCGTPGLSPEVSLFGAGRVWGAEGVNPGAQGRAGQVPPEQRAEGTRWCGTCLVPGSRGWLGFSQVDEVEGTGPAREAVSPGPEGEVHHGRMRACQEGRTPKTAGGRAGWGETAPPRASYPPG